MSGESISVLEGSFAVSGDVRLNLFNLLAMTAFAYCVIKIFFANIKRGGEHDERCPCHHYSGQPDQECGESRREIREIF